MILLPPTVLDGSIERSASAVETLPTAVEAQDSQDAKTLTAGDEIISIASSLNYFHLSAVEASGSEGSRPLVVDYPWLVRQLDALLGPYPNPEALHDVYFGFTNVIS